MPISRTTPADGVLLALGLVASLASCASREVRAPDVAAPAVSDEARGRAASLLRDFDGELARLRAGFTDAPAPEDWRWVRARLAHLVEVDQFVRKTIDRPEIRALAPDVRRAFDEGLAERWREVDASNTEELKGLLDRYGWFRISEFGPEADRDAWLLVQHADHDRAFQREVLDVLAGLVETDETSVRNYAYLHDRVAVGEGRPQRFGTQGQCVGPGRWEPYPIEDAETVDVRRAAYGLEPIADYAARFTAYCP